MNVSAPFELCLVSGAQFDGCAVRHLRFVERPKHSGAVPLVLHPNLIVVAVPILTDQHHYDFPVPRRPCFQHFGRCR